MAEIKEMYKKVVKDNFPETIKIDMGGQVLVYKKKVWSIYDADEKCDVERGLRYGENPDQPAAMYELINGNITLGDVQFFDPKSGLTSRVTVEDMLQVGKHPGKTNLTDVDNALNILRYVDKPACTIMKHNNPCGAACGSNSAEAFTKAFWCDRIAAFGGAVVFTRTVDVATAEAMVPYYFEVICAPDFEGAALDLLKKKWKNLRILQIKEIANLSNYKTKRHIDIKSLMDGGIILQESQPFKIKSAADLKPAETNYKGEAYKIKRMPTQREYDDMLFGWHVESGVSSNSALFVKDEATVAIGTGEQDRVGVVEIATFKAYTKFLDAQIFRKFGVPAAVFKLEASQGQRKMEDYIEMEKYTREQRAGLPGSIIVSDGFFPFRDGVDAAIAQGVTGIIQPGGSERDFESIQACNEADVTMVFAGQRLFKH